MKILLLILGMTVVTYLPRMIPVVLVEKLKINGKTEQFLSLIPYTAMTALVFPGVLSIAAPNPLIGLAGAVTAIALSLKKAPMLVVILGATAAVMLAYLLC
jgi:branched-subunit amino acid transport protein